MVTNRQQLSLSFSLSFISLHFSVCIKPTFEGHSHLLYIFCIEEVIKPKLFLVHIKMCSWATLVATRLRRLL